MKNRPLLPILLALLSLPALPATQAQDSSDPDNPLPEKLILRIPANTDVTVTAKRIRQLSPEEKTNPIRLAWGPDLITSTIQKRSRDLLTTNEWEGGRTSYVLVSGGRTVYQPSLKYPEDIQIDGQGAPDFSRGDFPALSWAARDRFVRGETSNGRKVYLLDRTKTSGREPTEKERVAEAEKAAEAQGILKEEFRQAYISARLARPARSETLVLDAKTLLPLSSTDGELEYSYTYRSGASSPLAIPPEFSRALEASPR